MGAGEMAHWLRACIALAGFLSSFSSIEIRGLTSTWNSSSGWPELYGHLPSCMHISPLSLNVHNQEWIFVQKEFWRNSDHKQVSVHRTSIAVNLHMIFLFVWVKFVYQSINTHIFKLYSVKLNNVVKLSSLNSQI